MTSSNHSARGGGQRSDRDLSRRELSPENATSNRTRMNVCGADFRRYEESILPSALSARSHEESRSLSLDVAASFPTCRRGDGKSAALAQPVAPWAFRGPVCPKCACAAVAAASAGSSLSLW